MELPNDLKIRPGSINLVTGPSGSGKSQSVPLMLSRMGSKEALVCCEPIDITKPLIDLFGCDEKGIKAINAVGLADATTFGRTYTELSVGQQARAELGLALLGEGSILFIDEFLANLDRATAKAVSWAAQKALRKWGKAALFVTSHDDLAEYLQPDVKITTTWNDKPKIEYRETIEADCPILGKIKFSKGKTKHWNYLRPLHYAAGNPATIHSVWIAEHPEIQGPAAVLVASYPDLHSAARNLATESKYKNVRDRRVASVLNREVVKLSRIVVCPQLRGIGIAAQLIDFAVPQLGATYVECVTSMSRWSTFLERVGFRQVPQTSHPVEAALEDWATQNRPPAIAHLDGQGLADWIETLSVRGRRHARRVIWSYYFHFVLHRKTKAAKRQRVPDSGDANWADAFDLAARRLIERPAYWIMGPVDPMTGYPEITPNESVVKV